MELKDFHVKCIALACKYSYLASNGHSKCVVGEIGRTEHLNTKNSKWLKSLHIITLYSGKFKTKSPNKSIECSLFFRQKYSLQIDNAIYIHFLTRSMRVHYSISSYGVTRNELFNADALVWFRLKGYRRLSKTTKTQPFN